MEQKNKFSIIALASIAMIGVMVFGTLNYSDIENNAELNTTEITDIYVSNSYTTIDIKTMKNISENIIEGIIIDKYEIIQYRSADGEYLKENSKGIAEKEPYIVYELLATDVIKNKNKDTNIYKFKTFGGNLNTIQIHTEVPEFKVNDKVIVFLEPTIDGEHYEITSGEFGIYKVSNDKAVNANSQISVVELKNSLR